MLNNVEIKTILNGAIDEMERAFHVYQRGLYFSKTYQIFAVRGDLSAYGMSNEAKILTINRDQMPNVQAYIETQRIWNETLVMLSINISKVHEKHTKTFKIFYDLWIKSNELMKDIFENKYCYRTEWALLKTS